MLTRDLISTGAYLQAFDAVPDGIRWTAEQVRTSLCETLTRRPKGTPVWLFAYGSLIWNPLFKFEAKERAVLHGWHRSFCIRIIAGRGQHDKPGRMLALESGGRTEGVAFRLSEKELAHELGLVWTREMVTGVYVPQWSEISMPDGSSALAIVFVMNHDHPFYEVDSSVSSVAPAIAVASGKLGSNADYVFRLDDSLRACGFHDPYVAAVATAVKETL